MKYMYLHDITCHQQRRGVFEKRHLTPEREMTEVRVCHILSKNSSRETIKDSYQALCEVQTARKEL